MEKPPDLIASSIIRLRSGVSNIAIELGRISRAGYPLIGTVESKKVHRSDVEQKIYDKDLGHWVYMHDDGTVRTLMAAEAAGIAILSGLFGDINHDDQRAELGIPLTDHAPPHFSWHEATPEGMFRRQFAYRARPELISAAQKHGQELQGCVDIVEPPRVYAAKRIPGIIHAEFWMPRTIATIPIDGTAIHSLDIEPDTFDNAPDRYER